MYNTSPQFSIFVIIISIAIIVGIIAIIYYKYRSKETEIRSLYLFLIIIIPSIALLISSAAEFEYVPKNHNETRYEFSNMVVNVDRISPMYVPIKDVILTEESSVSAQIFPNVSGIRIESVNLNPPIDTIISSDTKFKQMNTTEGSIIYSVPVRIQNTGQLVNNTYEYGISIAYFDGNSSSLKVNHLTFDWYVKLLDLNLVGYFGIVMTGVITSRVLTMMVKKLAKSKGHPNENPDKKEIQYSVLDKPDILWIIFSVIIAVIIYSTFYEQIQFTTVTIVNITLAFAFGFSFQKVLELAQDFKDFK